MTNSHLYERRFARGDGSSLGTLAEWIRPGSIVLELGPASGYFTRYLTQEMGCLVDAVELDAAMGAIASEWCRQLVIGDLENLGLDEAFGAARYDFVIIADVIEHLRNPAALLENIGRILKPEGVALLSVPNASYAGLIASLLVGEFEYGDEGILDRTHLRFFTRKSLHDLLRGCGFAPQRWHAIHKPLGESEFRTRIENLPASLTTTLRDMPDALAYQWVVAATSQVEVTNEIPLPTRSFEDTFPVRLFWRDSETAFGYGNSQVALAVVGVERQTIRFDLPLMSICGLRLSLADRSGFLRLYSVRVLGAVGQLLWAWNWHEGKDQWPAVDGLSLTDGDGACLAVIHQPENWVETAAIDANTPATVIEVELGWPMSSDYQVASRAWRTLERESTLEIDKIKAQVGERDALLSLRNEQLAERERLIAFREGIIAERDATISAKLEQIARCEQLIQERDQNLSLRTTQMHERESLIVARDATIALQSQQLAEREQLIVQRDHQIATMSGLKWWLKRPFQGFINRQ